MFLMILGYLQERYERWVARKQWRQYWRDVHRQVQRKQ